MIFNAIGSLGQVSKYKKGVVTLHISLPVKEAGCKWCEFSKYRADKDCIYCGLTGEPLFKDSISKIIGDLCPVEWEE